ncbi:MAG TPA: methyltransferase domain-containing protein [Pseudonocardiaceae bacterium]|nr:methyltransferase domain-containing protein [Pseudonocardiaceae bacterium]
MTAAQQDLTALISDRLTDSWRPAFTATPRELFIPDRALRIHADDTKTPIDRCADPDAWRRAVYSNDALITQFDDGAPEGEGDATSSSSMPSVMLCMLNHLDVHEGHRVLEIGTGTGYNTALLAHRLGAANVVSVEIDPGIARQARANLAAAGHAVRVITGDGAVGYPPGGPYDRVLATCSVATVPWAWVEQTRPGGVIVTPWGPPMANHHLLRIEVDQHGGVGTIVDGVEFMRLRSQRWQVTDEPDDFPDIAACSGTGLDPHEVLGNHSGLVPALRMGDCRAIFETDRDTGKEALWLLAADSWASVIDGKVRQAGARKLWDEAVAAYHWWLRHDCPARVQFHLTLTPHRQWVWLDDPTNIVTALP